MKKQEIYITNLNEGMINEDNHVIVGVIHSIKDNVITLTHTKHFYEIDMSYNNMLHTYTKYLFNNQLYSSDIWKVKKTNKKGSMLKRLNINMKLINQIYNDTN